MLEPFIGQIIMFAGGRVPEGWERCDGRLLPINQHQALFSILGTTYGGDGRTTFALPDLRGRVPVHAGAGPGLPPVGLGESGSYLTGGGAGAPEPGPDEHGAPFLGVSFLVALVGSYPTFES